MHRLKQRRLTIGAAEASSGEAKGDVGRYSSHG